MGRIPEKIRRFASKFLKGYLIYQLLLLTKDLFTEDEKLLVGYSTAYSKWCEIISYTFPSVTKTLHQILPQILLRILNHSFVRTHRAEIMAMLGYVFYAKMLILVYSKNSKQLKFAKRSIVLLCLAMIILTGYALLIQPVEFRIQMPKFRSGRDWTDLSITFNTHQFRINLTGQNFQKLMSGPCKSCFDFFLG